jgi:hypothetical protein
VEVKQHEAGGRREGKKTLMWRLRPNSVSPFFLKASLYLTPLTSLGHTSLRSDSQGGLGMFREDMGGKQIIALHLSSTRQFLFEHLYLSKR